MTSSDDEQRDLRLLKRIFATIDRLRARVASPDRILKPTPGTELAEDDRLSDPFQVSHAAASALTVAVDHLHALRCMVEDCQECTPNGMTFQITAHWTLLRAALENASRAIWLLGPESRSERVLRALRLQAANVTNSDTACRNVPVGPTKPKAQRIARVKHIAARAGLPQGKAVEAIRYSTIVRYSGDFLAHEPDHVEFLWRACSGAAHGDTWAILSLQDRKSIHSENGVSTEQLRVSIRGLSVVAAEVTALVEMSFGLFEHRDQPR